MKPFPTDYEPLLCSVDPITLTGLAIAGIAGIAGGTIASGMSGGSNASTAQKPEDPVAKVDASTPPQLTPSTTKPKGNSGLTPPPSFLSSAGGAGGDQQSFGQKTLLGS